MRFPAVEMHNIEAIRSLYALRALDQIDHESVSRPHDKVGKLFVEQCLDVAVNDKEGLANWPNWSHV
jgi:hypothetical protein